MLFYGLGGRGYIGAQGAAVAGGYGVAERLQAGDEGVVCRVNHAISIQYEIWKNEYLSLILRIIL